MSENNLTAQRRFELDRMGMCYAYGRLDGGERPAVAPRAFANRVVAEQVTEGGLKDLYDSMLKAGENVVDLGGE